MSSCTLCKGTGRVRANVYGLFPGGDPREFSPDLESCSPDEINRHAFACIAWDEGAGLDRGPSCATMGNGSVWTGGGFGVGTCTFYEACPECVGSDE
jgi:hypothetical protein